jgi:hypothetical protein
MVKVFKPTERKKLGFELPIEYSIFLGGTIENGESEDWQDRITRKLESKYGGNTDFLLNVFNPRRDKWNPELKQSIKNKEFSEQVNWELDHIEICDLRLFLIKKESLSPITLMEIGFSSGRYLKSVVCCPETFWRIGNVEMISDRSEFDFFNSEEETLECIFSIIDKHIEKCKNNQTNHGK